MLAPFTSVKKEQQSTGPRFQCLRCSCEFKPEVPRLGPESEEGWKPLFQNPGTSCALDLPAHIAGKVSLRGMCRGSPREEGLRGVGAAVGSGQKCNRLPAALKSRNGPVRVSSAVL